MGTNARDIGDFSRAVSAELRAHLARKKISVRAFALSTGLPLTTLHKTLNAQRVVDVEDLFAICVPLGIQPGDIIDGAMDELVLLGGLRRADFGRMTPSQDAAAPNVPTSAEDAPVLTREEEKALRRREYTLAAMRGRNDADVPYAE